MTAPHSRRATRGREVALVTCAQLPDADADTQRLIGPLAALGVRAQAVVWDDPTVDWAAFELAVVRSCWDYGTRRAEFLEWANRVPCLTNPAAVLAWNTDKRYLAQLDALGVNVVATTWVLPDDGWILPDPVSGSTDWVIKPAVSLAALDTGRYDVSDHTHRRLAADHVRRLQRAGRVVMVQPYMAGVDVEGETSLVFFGGRFSHAMRKGALLDGPDRGIDRRFAPNGGLDLTHRAPSAAQLELAHRALAGVPGGRERLLYARVDLVPDANGHPRVIEVELTEPQLYLAHVPGAAERFASVIAARASCRSPAAPFDEMIEVGQGGSRAHGARRAIDPGFKHPVTSATAGGTNDGREDDLRRGGRGAAA